MRPYRDGPHLTECGSELISSLAQIKEDDSAMWVSNLAERKAGGALFQEIVKPSGVGVRGQQDDGLFIAASLLRVTSVSAFNGTTKEGRDSLCDVQWRAPRLRVGLRRAADRRLGFLLGYLRMNGSRS